MTSSVQYKFRTQNVNKTLSFDGPSITAIELKRAICNAENIKTELFDLVFVDSFSKKSYAGDDPILRNSSVTVVRVPVENGAKVPKITNPEISGATQSDSLPDNASHISSEEFEKMSEAERLKHALYQSSYKYSSNNFKKKINPNSQTVQAPPDYLCHRCNQLGHFPKACPLLNVRRTTGIPNEELMETTPDDPQAMLHPSGRFVIPIMHYKAREARRLQEEQRKVGILPTDSKTKQEKKEDPPHLKCPLCNNLFNDAVTAICCGQNFCSDCIQQKMVEAGIADVPFQCPMCNKHIGDKELQENMTLREDVFKYKKSLLNPLTIQTPIDVSSELLIKPKPETVEVTEAAPNVIVPVEPVKLPTVNLSAMFAPKPQPAPPILNVNPFPVPEIPDLTKPPPMVVDPLTLAFPTIDQTFKSKDAPTIPLLPPKTNVTTKKNIIRNIELDDRDQAAIDKVWEKLAVADDDIDLATLFDDPKTPPKLEKKSRSRSPLRSPSRDKSKRRSPKRDRRDTDKKDDRRELDRKDDRRESDRKDDRRESDRKDDRRYDVDKERRRDRPKKDDVRDSGRPKDRTSESSSRRRRNSRDEKTKSDSPVKDVTIKVTDKDSKEKDSEEKTKLNQPIDAKQNSNETEKVDNTFPRNDFEVESKKERRESKEKRRESKRDERRKEKESNKDSRDEKGSKSEKVVNREEKVEKEVENGDRQNEEKSRKRDSRGEKKANQPETSVEKYKNNGKKDEGESRVDQKRIGDKELERREKRRKEKDDRVREKSDRNESRMKKEEDGRTDKSRRNSNEAKDSTNDKKPQSLKNDEPAIKKRRMDSPTEKTNGSSIADGVPSTAKSEKMDYEHDEKAAEVSRRSHRSSSHKKKHKKSKSEDREKKKKKKKRHDSDEEDDERSRKKRKRHDSDDEKSEQRSKRHHKEKKKKRNRKSRKYSDSDDNRHVEVS
uniref:E3 ubiquitin-protein ligase RBBP6 n=1 Tax=Panagrolaimus sp. JU765 TaxID=591449 RepID=A0AC34PUF7_9BILA